MHLIPLIRLHYTLLILHYYKNQNLKVYSDTLHQYQNYVQLFLYFERNVQVYYVMIHQEQTQNERVIENILINLELEYIQEYTFD